MKKFPPRRCNVSNQNVGQIIDNSHKIVSNEQSLKIQRQSRGDHGKIQRSLNILQ